MGLRDAIKNEINNASPSSSTKSLIIEQQLNKLFYIQPNYKEEIKMLKMQASLKSEDRYGLHASAILASGDKFCYREQVLSLFFKMSQGENVKIGLKRIFEEGNFIGEKWQRLFIRGEIGKAEDMDISRFAEEYDLSYTPDALIKLNKKYLVEIKSQNTFIFKKTKGHPTGEKQCLFYMYLEQVKNGFVLVEDKNDQNFKIIPVQYDESKLDDYIERLENIQKYKKQLKKHKKMIDGICKNSACKRALECNMRDACFNIGMGRIKLK